MKTPKPVGLNILAPKVPNAFTPQHVAPEVKASITDLHRMAMGVAMQNLMKRIRPNPKTL